jgi:hypothetical protein
MEDLPIKGMIYEFRGQKVMLDSDLARLYEIETKALNRAVKRNSSRFPELFMFQLTDTEADILRYQIGTAKPNRKRRFNPYVFTEQGVAMLSSVINSEKAIQMNIQIMIAFVNMRRYAFDQTEVTGQIDELRRLLMLYIEKNDERVNDIIKALNNLLASPPANQLVIGFKAE